MRDIDELTRKARGFIALYTPMNATIRGLYSGGKDSAVATHIGSTLPGFNGVAHIVTLTGPMSMVHSRGVINKAKELGWDCLTASPFTTLPMIAINSGLPGPAAHNWAFRFLKERPMKALAQKAKQKDRRKNLIWLSGIRKAESAARNQKAPAVTKQGKTTLLNPILDWSDEEVKAYIQKHNLSVANLHHSDDCQCGAYAQPIERPVVFAANGDQKRYIEMVEQIATLGREIQLLEVKYGFRDESDVTPPEFCTWGHGLNTTRLKELRAKHPDFNICNKCGPLEEAIVQRSKLIMEKNSAAMEEQEA